MTLEKDWLTGLVYVTDARHDLGQHGIQGGVYQRGQPRHYEHTLAILRQVSRDRSYGREPSSRISGRRSVGGVFPSEGRVGVKRRGKEPCSGAPGVERIPNHMKDCPSGSVELQRRQNGPSPLRLVGCERFLHRCGAWSCAATTSWSGGVGIQTLDENT